jgi:hypothetical protein
MATQQVKGTVTIYENGYCELYLCFDWGQAPLYLDPAKPDLEGVIAFAQKQAALLGWSESWVKYLTPPQALGINITLGNRQ